MPTAPRPAEGLLPAVYDEFRRLAAAKLAGEPAGLTLNATALVHEAYLRLGAAAFASQREFLRAAAVAMQRVLVDHARQKRARKRGGRAKRFQLSEADRIFVPEPDTVLAIDEALAKLEAVDPDAVELARLRLFAGLSIAEAAEVLGMARATAFREWAYVRAWLSTALGQ